jgi:hypothetical protein
MYDENNAPHLKTGIEHTLFDCNADLLFLDKASDFRNAGPKLNAAIVLAERIRTTILLTATPVITRPSV